MKPTEDDQLRRTIRKTALMNAVKHNGKAQASSVTASLLGSMPELRSRAQEVLQLVEDVVDEVNRLSAEQQRLIVNSEFSEDAPEEKITIDKNLPPLPNAQRYDHVVTRFSPNPDCVLHLGSARAIVLSYEYARIYDGKFILRFEDTDPRLKRSVLRFYDLIREDLAWLGCRPDQEYIQSDRMRIYYEYAERLLRDGNAYVCTCQPAHYRERVSDSRPCPCRESSTENQLELWKRMLEGDCKEGQAVVRVKTDLNHPNPAVRDWPALRVIDPKKHPHPRVGSTYVVWPLYNFACGIDDHLMGVTHIIRGKEHLTNMVRQKYMYNYLEWQYPEAIHYGRLKITGTSLSKSVIIEGVRKGHYTGWDDPRLATFVALRKRGITPESIRRTMIDVGPKPVDVVLSWENLYAYNRKILDPRSDRYFFIRDPIQLQVRDVPRTFVARLRLHPDHQERGYREYVVKPKGEEKSALFWSPQEDLHAKQADRMVRIMGLFNIKIQDVQANHASAVFLSEPLEEARKKKASLIHSIPVGSEMPCRVVMPDGREDKGVAEGLCRRLKSDDIIQFVRFGFVRVDSVGTELRANYAHR